MSLLALLFLITLWLIIRELCFGSGALWLGDCEGLTLSLLPASIWEIWEISVLTPCLSSFGFCGNVRQGGCGVFSCLGEEH